MEMSDISVSYRYIGDISSILGDFFRFFLQTTFVCKNHFEKARHTIYHDIFVLGTNTPTVYMLQLFFLKYKFKDILWDSPFKKTVNQLKNISISIFFYKILKLFLILKLQRKKRTHLISIFFVIKNMKNKRNIKSREQ